MFKKLIFVFLLVVLGLLALSPGEVLAHNCSSMSDCEGTMGYNMGLAILGGLVALTSGLLGHVVTTQFTDPGKGRPPWSLLRRPTPEAQWDEGTESWQPR